MILKTILFLFSFSLFVIVAQAQINNNKTIGSDSYHQAIGIKFPGGLSITYKNFVRPLGAVEAQATFWNYGFRATAFYEFNFNIPQISNGFKLFLGPGAHIGTFNSLFRSIYYYNNGNRYSNTYLDLGVDGIFGADYKFKKIPLNLSLDWEPSISFFSNPYFGPFFSGFGGIAAP